MLRKWFVIGCLRCRSLRIVRSDQKTAECLHCGHVNKLDWRKIRILFEGGTPRDALLALNKLKLKKIG